MTGIGTLTHRVGDQVVGFGHPMLFGGSTDMPMTAAYIHQVVASQMLSFKLGTASKPLGVILQDRAPGIAGVVGTTARMMPMRIDIASKGHAASFDMDVFRNRDLSPILVRMALASSLISAEKLMGETTVSGSVMIGLKGHSPVVVENVFAGPQGLGQAVLGLTQPIAKILQNPFEPVTIDSVSFELSVEERTRGALIDGVRLTKGHFEPGDTLRGVVTLAPLWGDREQVRINVPLPLHTPKGRLMLRVTNENKQQSQDAKRLPGVYEADHLGQLLGLLSKPGRNDVLAVDLISPSKTVTVGGREVPRLPASVMAALSQARDSEAVEEARQSTVARIRVPTRYVLDGSQTVLISVGKPGEGLVFSGKGSSGEQKR